MGTQFGVWGGVHFTGVGILFGRREIVVEEVFVVVQGRMVGCDAAWGANKMRVFAIYGSHTSAGRQEMFALLEPHLGTNRQVIVGGDFNVELGKGLDASDSFISRLMSRHNLVDGGKMARPMIRGPTWHNSRG